MENNILNERTIEEKLKQEEVLKNYANGVLNSQISKAVSYLSNHAILCALASIHPDLIKIYKDRLLKGVDTIIDKYKKEFNNEDAEELKIIKKAAENELLTYTSVADVLIEESEKFLNESENKK